MSAALRYRVLVVDDNPSIHEDFRRVLAPAVNAGANDLDDFAGALFGAAPAGPRSPAPPQAFDVEYALQGQEARDKVAAARTAGRPFALAFVDMRMPPGWDGLTTIGKLWEVDPALHVTICTAHADRSWEEIAAALAPYGASDRWLVLKKPFDKVEAAQLAHVMTAKWGAGIPHSTHG